MIELNNYATTWHKFNTMAEYREPFDTAIRTTLWMLPFEKDHPLFKKLLEGKVDSDDALTMLMATDEEPERKFEENRRRAIETIQAYLHKNVLAAHPDGTYTLHSRFVETFFHAA